MTDIPILQMSMLRLFDLHRLNQGILCQNPVLSLSTYLPVAFDSLTVYLPIEKLKTIILFVHFFPLIDKVMKLSKAKTQTNRCPSFPSAPAVFEGFVT